MKWRCVARAQELLRCWDGEQHAVFFDPASGDTHLVSTLAGLLVDVVGDGSMDFEALLLELQDSLELAEDQALSSTLRTHLQRLTDIGLLQEVAA